MNLKKLKIKCFYECEIPYVLGKILILDLDSTSLNHSGTSKLSSVADKK